MGLFVSGKLNCTVEKVFGVDDLMKALEVATEPGRGGKVLVKFSE